MRLRGIAALWAVLAVAAATGLFLLKYEVIALEEDLAGLTRAIEADRRAIHVLRAEWSYLNQPESLERMAASHLDLVPLGPTRMATLDALPFRPRPAGAANGGGDGDGAHPPVAAMRLPRVLNPGSADAIPLPGQKPTVLAEIMRTEP
jgi:hypothetical protein